MINAKTRNALTAISLLSFNNDSEQGVWRYAADTASNSNAASAQAPTLRSVTLH